MKKTIFLKFHDEKSLFNGTFDIYIFNLDEDQEEISGKVQSHKNKEELEILLKEELKDIYIDRDLLTEEDKIIYWVDYLSEDEDSISVHLVKEEPRSLQDLFEHVTGNLFK